MLAALISAIIIDEKRVKVVLDFFRYLQFFVHIL